MQTKNPLCGWEFDYPSVATQFSFQSWLVYTKTEAIPLAFDVAELFPCFIGRNSVNSMSFEMHFINSLSLETEIFLKVQTNPQGFI